MQELASESYENAPVPRRVKISSKRQITIPVDVYERHQFARYALLTETDRGFSIQPLQLADDDEELTLSLLRYLMENGFEGEELLQKYAEMKPKFFSYYKAIEQSEADIAAGQVVSYDEMRQRIREEHGV